jgi:biotin transport system substrate-specific component
MGPTGGYLIGYLIASFATGYLAERKHLAWGLLVGNVIIYVCGASYLSTFIGPSKALLLGVVPFLLGDALKMIAGWKILQFVKKSG